MANIPIYGGYGLNVKPDGKGGTAIALTAFGIELKGADVSRIFGPAPSLWEVSNGDKYVVWGGNDGKDPQITSYYSKEKDLTVNLVQSKLQYKKLSEIYTYIYGMAGIVTDGKKPNMGGGEHPSLAIAKGNNTYDYYKGDYSKIQTAPTPGATPPPSPGAAPSPGLFDSMMNFVRANKILVTVVAAGVVVGGYFLSKEM